MSEGKPTSDGELDRVVFSLVLGALFTLPLVADTVTRLLGFYVFLLGDPKVQFIWGSLVQATAGVPFYLEARRSGSSADLAVASGTTVTYSFSTYQAFFHRPSGPGDTPLVLFEATAVCLTLLLALRLWRVSRRSSHT